MKFEKYSFTPQIQSNLAEMGWIRPTDIQFKSIQHILKGEDVLAIAQTGTGKTAAFAIPVLQRLQQSKSYTKSIRCIVMVPTRELALQISNVFNQIGRNTGIKCFCVFGGIENDQQIAQLQSGLDVLIATPGRMFDLVNQGYIKLDKIETLVLDEADHMLDMGFIRDIRDLIRFLPRKRQTLFFSATIDAEIKKLAYSLVDNPIRIQISPKNPVSKNIDHSVAFVEMDDKRFFLERLINENPDTKILVFVRTKVRAERVCSAMKRLDIDSETLHGDKEQKERLYTLKKFREGSVKLLIATDVSARGIDIPDVDYVVNYDLPEQPDNYVHRVGRTGRGIKRGKAVSFCSSEERILLDDIEAYTGNEIRILKIEKTEYQQTIDFSAEAQSDWKTLMKNAEIDLKAAEDKKARKRKMK